MEKAKLVSAEQLGFEEVSEDWVVLQINNERYVMDMDTLYDLAFRSAAFLAYFEGREASPCRPHVLN